MEQAKFRTALPNTPHKNHILNKAKKLRSQTQQPIGNQTVSYPNLDRNIRKQRFTDAMGRISSSKKQKIGNAKVDIMNRHLSMQTIKKMKKVQTQQSQSAGSQIREIEYLKSYIRNITKICNKIQTNKTKNKKFRKGKVKDLAQRLTVNNLPFTDIQEEKIEKQKLYLNNFQHIRKNNSKMMSTTILGQEKAIEERLIVIYRHIDRLYQILQEMENLGYHTKNNKSVINFCTINKICLSKIFLYESNSHKDAFSIKTPWFVLATSEQAKQKLSNFFIQGEKIDYQMIGCAIEDLVDHLQRALSQKKLLDISKVGDYIQSRLQELQFQDVRGENIKMLRFPKSKAEQCNFSKQLRLLEQKYGSMNIVTKVSRKRFQDLNRTFDKLQSLL